MLASLPVFMLSLLVLPVSVEEELEHIMRNFLWGSTTEKKKFQLLSWDVVCLSVKCGGLGINKLLGIQRWQGQTVEKGDQ